MATSRFVYWNHTRRSPRAQQKGRNSRTAYRFSTDHRSREYLPVISRSLSLSPSLSLFSFSFSLAGSFKGPPLLLPLSSSENARIPRHIVLPIISTCLFLCVGHSDANTSPRLSGRYERDTSLIRRWSDESCDYDRWGVEHGGESSADLCYIRNIYNHLYLSVSPCQKTLEHSGICHYAYSSLLTICMVYLVSTLLYKVYVQLFHCLIVYTLMKFNAQHYICCHEYILIIFKTFALPWKLSFFTKLIGDTWKFQSYYIIIFC